MVHLYNLKGDTQSNITAEVLQSAQKVALEPSLIGSVGCNKNTFDNPVNLNKGRIYRSLEKSSGIIIWFKAAQCPCATCFHFKLVLRYPTSDAWLKYTPEL